MGHFTIGTLYTSFKTFLEICFFHLCAHFRLFVFRGCSNSNGNCHDLPLWTLTMKTD